MTTTAARPTDHSVGRGHARGSKGKPSGRRRRPNTFWTYWTTRNVVLGVIALAVWLVGGLVVAADTVAHRSGLAQAELQEFQASLKSGDVRAASSHLRAGRQDLTAAQGAAGAAGVRLASLLPRVGPTVSDLDHLLAAADILITSAEDALGIYDDFSGPDSTLFQDNTFDLDAIRSAQSTATDIEGSVDEALGELRQVHGEGLRGALAVEKRDAAVAQVGSLRTDIAEVKPVIQALPSVLGAQGPKTYLVAVMNTAEMRASGGAPLSVAFIRFDKGRLSIPLKGTTSELTNLNQKTAFEKLAGDPWQPVGPQRFVNTNFNPSFPVAAEQMIRAAPSNFKGLTVDGVIGIDVVAISSMLAATGPIDVQDYGSLTADNVVQKLIIDAYSSGEDPAVAARHDVNERLMTIMLSRLTEGGGLAGKAKALAGAVPSRHLQVYFRDPRLQNLILAKGFGGSLPLPDVGNLSAVYTQNTNQSKMDVFQQRTVKETVRLRTDGSAEVTRRVRIENRSPDYVGTVADPKIGYQTRWAGSQVISMLPPGARVTGSPSPSAVDDPVKVYAAMEGVDQDGRTYAQASVLLPPKTSTTLTWTYVVASAARPEGGALRYFDYIAPQATLNASTLELEVIAPMGWHAAAAPGWTVAKRHAVLTTPMNASTVLQLPVAPR